MDYKGFLLDIDNTLYDYEKTHKLANNAVIDSLSVTFTIPQETIRTNLITARKQIHAELAQTAASHNRLLYFQRMFELLNINPIQYSYDVYNLYWDTFIDNIILYEDVLEFLKMIKPYKVCLVTDLTADVQHKKMQKLKLFDYAGYAVISEEAGIEKPHPYMFMLGLKKMELTANEVCMIGDNYSKDIVGATNLGIRSFWLNTENKKEELNDLTTEFKNFKELMGYIQK
ncbi:MAG: HAD family hydrolase [Candidatus Margulisiibacteriota bacterium]|nr:MAG: hypothetical protein A2X43_03555 [Candidatus Margulisbacteria bacterium GWD2_39_127]OGI02511.1 MAG: hypothetical protein A2X42_07490 [Candidatus Margulisbacteria bacterium GWF2_38_17]OGI11004.1 MAG: hypothetical protein A2X41_02015 [Candidatus Margulisbacteria bacterium GWE2_39_32]PZM83196.1 MAG: HAD family hydrolase [Candidatus Margulisiibacteriota bacterium]HAR62499.1 hydrolase [Candidatus Margulisiibacteriota bacterium]